MLDFMDHNKYLMLIGRVLLVLVYVYFISHWRLSFSDNFPGFGFADGYGPVGTIARAGERGIPAILVWTAFAIKFFGGTAIILGFQTRLASLALIFFVLCTAFIYHLPNGPATFYVVFFKELSMIGGLLILAVVGPGELSLDGRNKLKVRSSAS